MSAAVVDRLMALADDYAGAEAELVAAGIDRKPLSREVLRAALVEALDMGEPVCFVHEYVRDDPAGWVTKATQDPQYIPLYAAPKDAP